MYVGYLKNYLNTTFAKSKRFSGAMNEDAMATAYFVEVADQLFDSFNETLKKDIRGKRVKCWLSKISPHLKFWEETGPIVNEWEFVSALTGGVVRPWS